MKKEKEIYLILNNIRSAHNVGAIFRTADAVGVSKIFLVGYTPTPLDKFERARKDIAKTALGAEKSIKWDSVKSIKSLLNKLKKEKIKIIAIEQSEKSIDYKKIKQEDKVAFVVGNEVSGIDKKILNLCDEIVEISMRGEKESLNVSVALGVVLFRILNV